MKSDSKRIQMPRWTVTFPGWKELHIDQFYMAPTYRGVLGGTTERINKMVIRGLPARVGAIFCAQRRAGVIPVYFPKPSDEQMRRPFPDFLCIADATDAPIQNDTLTLDTFYSRVACCWFTNDVNRSVGELIRNGIPPFTWDDYAENCEL